MLKTAFKFIFYDKAKSFGALMGVVISTFLIGQQVGVFTFLTNAMRGLSRFNTQYIWVIDSQTENANALGKLDARIQRELESFNGVAKVHPIFIGNGSVQLPDGQASGATLIGVDASSFAGLPPSFEKGTYTDLLADGAMAVDVFDKQNFQTREIGTPFELNKRKVYIAALTRGVRGFGAGYIFTTIDRARMLSNASNSATSAFLIETVAGANKDDVCKLINKNVFGVQARKGEEFCDTTMWTVLRTTSIATSIGTLVIFALISGFFIVGLTLYSAAVDRLKDYGTMKAIGATNGYLARLIFLQGIIIATTGFGIGYLMV
ncbi:MAG: ABC transporter permease, partial [Bacteroidia bacterium]